MKNWSKRKSGLKHKRCYFLLVAVSLLLTACNEKATRWALGTLERERIVLKATSSEIIVAEPVAEGQQVTKGTLLVQLDNRRQKVKVARAEAEVVIASSYLQKLLNGARAEDIEAASSRVDGAKAILIEAEKSYLRNKNLLEKGLISQGVLDKSVATKDTALAKLSATNEQLQRLTNGSRKEDLDQAQAKLDAAIAQRDLALYGLAELSIKATRNGYLDSLPWHVGERVEVGANLAILLADANPFARVYIPEPWRVKIKAGDVLKVKIDGIEKVFQGKVSWISNTPSFTPYYALNETDRARLVYVAKVVIEDNKNLPTGLPAQVELP